MTVSSATSQSRYPSKAVVARDTVVITTMPQIRAANQLFLDRLECYEVRDTLYRQVGVYQKIVANFERQDSVRRAQIENLTQENIDRESIATLLTKENGLLQKEVERQRWIVRVGGVGAGVLIVLAILF